MLGAGKIGKAGLKGAVDELRQNQRWKNDGACCQRTIGVLWLSFWIWGCLLLYSIYFSSKR
jgi:hypothetical protein